MDIGVSEGDEDIGPPAQDGVFSPEFLSSLDVTIGLLQAWREEVRVRTSADSPMSVSEVSTGEAAEFLDFFLTRLAGRVDWYQRRCAIAQSAPPSAEALAAQVVVGMLAPNLMRADYAGSFGALDAELSALLSELMWLPPVEGLSMYSGTAALHAAIASAAREAGRGGHSADDLLVLVGPRAHSSIEKLCSFCGLRSDAVLRLPVIDVDLVQREVASMGRSVHIAALVGTAGDADTGTIDDFVAWKEMQRALRLDGHTSRLICDCVLSWPLLSLSREDVYQAVSEPQEAESVASYLDSLSAMRTSDFWAIDFHKWMGAPLGAAHLLLRRELLAHLAPTDMSDTLHESPHEFVVDTTRSAAGPAAALLNMQSQERMQVRRRALRGLLLARRSATLAAAVGWYATPTQPHGPIVCLAPASSSTAAKELCLSAAAAIERLGGPVGSVRWLPVEERWVLRFCFVHPDAPLEVPELVAAGIESVGG